MRTDSLLHAGPIKNILVAVDASEQAGYQVTDLSVAEPTLETVFINLTGRELRE